MPDYYTRNPEELKGQPKATIANYVEENGILVPKRYSGLEEALDSDKTFIMRSEHEQDYNGASDLMSSPVVNRERIEQAREILERDKEWLEENPPSVGDYYYGTTRHKQALEQIGIETQEQVEEKFFESNRRTIENSLRFLGKEYDEFKAECSYSYWEFIEGANCTVMADTAIKGRYHIFISEPNKDKKKGEVDTIETYRMTNEKGEVEFLGGHKEEISLVTKKQIKDIINFYEDIKGLDRFDQNHCPIIETQITDTNIYFLQYHRGQDFIESSFPLERELEEGEMEVDFVRGATGPEGLELVLRSGIPRKEENETVQDNEAFLQPSTYSQFPEFSSRDRRVQILMENREGLASLASQTGGHIGKSLFCKPKITVGLKFHKFKEEFYRKIDSDELLFGENRDNVRVPIRLVSDGNKAYIKVLK